MFANCEFLNGDNPIIIPIPIEIKVFEIMFLYE
jgi:hypothetical protein